jgi:TonB-linked SusC/RagA family outer membrane protein
VGDQSSFSIKLIEDTQALSEIVVVGYGTQTKINLTGAVSSIAKEELLDRPVTNVSSAIQGLTPGVTVTSGTGRPGQDGSTIRIRGVGTLNTSDPYILVDGIETGTINQIDPNDIESMSILKDAASAAIYGAKAANGVILITTKRGKVGKPTVSYSGNVSLSNVATLIDRLNSYDHARLYNYALTQDGSAPRFTDEDLQLFKDGSDPYGHPNTVWTDYIYRTGFMHKHNLNVSGGSEDIKYMASAGFLGQEGTLRNSDRQQFNLRTNMDIKLSEKFTMRTNMAFINNKYSDPNASYGGGYSGFIWQADRIAPWIPYKKEDGTYGSISDGNPAAWKIGRAHV